MNQTPLDVLKNSLLAAFGLFCFGVGVYLTIQANIGVAPWDAFCIGLSQKLGILYGTASIMISLTIVVIDLLLKERIGIGMILDAIVVGKAVDFCNWLNPVPALQNPFAGVLLQWLIFHKVCTDNLPAVPVVEAHAQSFINHLLRKL